MQIPLPLMNSQSPVSWTPQGHPHSAQFNDVYHTASGALAQAEHVFLQGCNLPKAWQGQNNTPLPVFTILETGFGLGLNFLSTWHAWRQDPRRCRRLHFVSLEAYPVTVQDIRRSVAAIPQLQALGEQLAQRYPLMLPGLYRIEFDEEAFTGEANHVVLTLCVGDARRLLPQLQFSADAVFLDGFSPAKNPELWGSDICQGLAKLSHPGTRIATWCVAGSVRSKLQAAGFQLERVIGLPPKREALKGIFAPPNLSRKSTHKSTQAGVVSHQREAIVIGAGIAGAAACRALAQRDWQVTLVDKASSAAQGASGLPMGLGLPYISADDALLSQITRSGVQWLEHVITACRLAPKFWCHAPVDQLIDDEKASIAIPENRETLNTSLFQIGTTDEGQTCRHFHHGIRLEGAAFIHAMLRHAPGLQYLWNTHVTRLERTAHGMWQLFDQGGKLCAQSPHVIVATAMESLPLCGIAPTGVTPVRGQMALGLPQATLPTDLLDARTGHGHFLLPARPDAGWSWSMGSTFERGSENREIDPADHQALFAKLQILSPKTAQALRPQFEARQLGAFVEIRCTSTDHLPMVGAVPDLQALAQRDASQLMNEQCPVLPGLYLLSALGSRGLSTGAWCAELLASMMCNEPWPFTRQQAMAVLPARFEIRQQRKQSRLIKS